jgi:molybdate transport system permease protein
VVVARVHHPSIVARPVRPLDRPRRFHPGLQNAFESLGRRYLEAAATLGARPLDAFASVVLPLSVRGYLTATVMGFAHTLGEFGVVLMVGGNIPGSTRVISIAIYDHVEALEYGVAHRLSLILLLFAFAAMLALYAINRRWRHD